MSDPNPYQSPREREAAKNASIGYVILVVVLSLLFLPAAVIAFAATCTYVTAEIPGGNLTAGLIVGSLAVGAIAAVFIGVLSLVRKSGR